MRMHLWLVAYDFPPIPSPQALRWAYLARELVRAGHRVEVIAPDVPGYGPGGLPELPPQVRVHRVEPGRVTRLLVGRRGATAVNGRTAGRPVPELDAVNEKGADSHDCGTAPTASDQVPVAVKLNWKGRLRLRVMNLLGLRPGLNWKGQLAEYAKSLMSRWMFPDYRAEWIPSATAKLDELLAVERPDVVVVSHEPACSLPVGLHAARCGVPLAVDMGDPVLANYTPKRRRKQAFSLERAVCLEASLISVTTKAAADLLRSRHGLPEGKVVVVEQGFDPSFDPTSVKDPIEFEKDKLELLYTGSFYSFRRAEALLDAVLNVPDVRLNVASISVPDYLFEASEAAPDKIRLLGYISHCSALAAQRHSDVLVNIANADPVQVPGKFYEYLGAGKPFLHLSSDGGDATSMEVHRLGVGWTPASDVDELSELLSLLVQRKQASLPLFVSEPSRDIARFSWAALADRWASAWAKYAEERR